jgi:hypothetical protein
MKTQLRSSLFILGLLLSMGFTLKAAPLNASDFDGSRGRLTTRQSAQGGSWYFTVAGDSRDCGDLIMPKIAKSIENSRAKTPASFYWHLGDLRSMTSPDCDMIIPETGACNKFPPSWGRFPLDYYLTHVWSDFIQHQIEPFGDSTFFVGIGNHELYAGHTREDFLRTFQKWLTQTAIFTQLVLDGRKGIAPQDPPKTYYHVVMNGVSFIYLDNATTEFDGAQIVWFSQVVAADVADASVKTIVVGMHEALPNSTFSSHAMDDTCSGLCSGQRVYDLLYQASIGSKKKNVYLIASHAHNFQENIFQTPEHQGQVLPGWIIGTAGAFQYFTNEQSTKEVKLKDCWKTKICYGYLMVEVRPDGTINPQFQMVTPDSEPKGDQALSTYCFTANGGPFRGKPPKLTCACGEAK